MNGNGSQIWVGDKLKISHKPDAKPLFNRLPNAFPATDFQNNINPHIVFLQGAFDSDSFR